MAKLKALSVELIAPLSQKEAILAYLQKKGTLEIVGTDETPAETQNAPSREQADADAALIRSALAVLDRVAPEKKPLTAMLEPRTELTDETYGTLAAALPQTLEAARGIKALCDEKADLEAENIRLATARETLLPWQYAEVPRQKTGSGRVVALSGCIRQALPREELLAHCARAYPQIECVDVEILSEDAELTVFTAWCLAEDAPEIEQALREIGFLPAPDFSDASPAEKLKRLDSALVANKGRLREIDEKLAGAAKARRALEFAADELSIRRGRQEASEKLGSTGRAFVLRGYAAERDAGKLKKYVEEKFDAVFEASEPGADDDPPVILKNGWFAAPLENITGMYSLPGRADIDPTGPMSFFYYLFFGMMLSDAGYGLLMALATGGALLFRRNMERGMKNNCKMYLLCGLSTVFWGAMYGSWFGDAPQVIMREFFHKEIGPLHIWTDAVSDTMNVLIMCFILGLAHLFWGVLMKGWTDVKNGNRLDALFDTVPTFITVIGIAPIFFGLFAQDTMPKHYSPLATFFWKTFTAVHANLKSVSTYILLAGLALVIATAGRHSKSVGGKIGGGLYAVYSLFSGYLGDVLSYARLLALGMATGVIAQVMNMLGTLPGNPAVKIIMFIPVFIAGHAANMAINLIGAYVHTNRLQYVEFFSKFYEGGGRAFEPFEAKTKFYRFKEEI